MENKNIIIGLTGSWSSGCTTAADILEKKGFIKFSLSSEIKEISKSLINSRLEDKLGEFIFKKYGNEDKVLDIIKCVIKNSGELRTAKKREIYQDIGNALRDKNENDYLVRSIYSENEKVFKEKNIVIDGIKNLGEHEFFSKNFNNYYLVNINSPYELRYNRVRRSVDENEFDECDYRDSKEDFDFGQQVQKCVDLADLVLLNKNGEREFKEKLLKNIEILIGKETRNPYPDEIFMTSAYVISLNSRCLKRKVGAIIVKGENIIASGYNDVPNTTRPEQPIPRSCKEEYNKCYSSYVKEKFLKPEYIGKKEDIKQFHEIKDIYNSHLDLCRAIHAEERAIIQLARLGGISIEGSVIYTTTFPCQLCSKKIIETGIVEVVYCEPYPNIEGKKLLYQSVINLREFEGIKAKAYFKLLKK